MSCANIVNNLVQKYSQNCYITNGKNIINYLDNKAFSTKDSKRTMKVEVYLPSYFDPQEYKGRVYMINLEFNIFYAKIGVNPDKQSDIEDSRITKFTQQFVFDTTWKYRIEPYDVKAPVIIKVIPELFFLEYKEYIDEKQNKLIYEFYLDSKKYIVIDNVLTLTSIYPLQQAADNLKIIYSLV